VGWAVRGSNPGRGNFFLLLQNVQAGSGTHPAPYSMGTGILWKGKAAGAWGWRLISIYCPRQKLDFPKTEKKTNPPKLLGSRKVTWTKFHSGVPQTSGASLQNLVPTTTGHPLFVHPWVKLDAYSACMPSRCGHGDVQWSPLKLNTDQTVEFEIRASRKSLQAIKRRNTLW